MRIWHFWGLIPHGDSEVFLCPMFMTRWKKHLSLFLYWAQNLPSFLIYLQNTTTLSTLLILPVCSMHVICEFCNGPSICFIRCVASGSSGHTRDSAPLQLWDINRWADSYHDYSILTEIFKLSVSWIPRPKALLGIALFNPLTPKIQLSPLVATDFLTNHLIKIRTLIWQVWVFPLPVYWIMQGYYREKLHGNFGDFIYIRIASLIPKPHF